MEREYEAILSYSESCSTFFRAKGATTCELRSPIEGFMKCNVDDGIMRQHNKPTVRAIIIRDSIG